MAEKLLRLPTRPDAPGDAELVTRARDGERWAEEALYRRHGAWVLAMVTRLAGDPAEAEDVTQDAFVTAFDRLAQLREPAAFRGWLAQTAVRLVHRRFRFQRLKRRLGLERGPQPTFLQPAAGSSPEAAAQLMQIDAALAALPAADRIAWTLRYVDDLSLEEVAQAAGCSLATAKRRIAAARRRLAPHLPEDADE